MNLETLTQNTVVLGILGAMLYGGIFFARVRLDPDEPETFDSIKFATTVLLGGVFGAISAVLGIQPTYEHVGFALTSYAGTVALVEYGIKALINGERRQAQRGFGKAIERFLATTMSHGTSRGEVSESIEEGTDEYSGLDESEQRERWEGRFPEEEALLQRDDETLLEGENEGVRQTDESGINEDNSEDTSGGLPPA
ncbi:hypothetical protein [Halalkalicoccus jeotgali]|uniref:Uncharacterized protein n=1 Tax=Halalkalicoccus jeotgali (strain DSM 18796 / CECT 7217 / JCM 14584 / KCTC 4019 / B3) TaxID=795797 RepID=D8J9N8_HALJB|nr:hypothetical protein [Halalkalicoccus jeotgali]ADJ14450.1 hypothetical protein HacjB3_05295 [Halalkalicoccus jeotgali B3]ELY40166.1 hypothetical protein C497_03680 [Halalkalicoccus jeotgali B3]